MVSQWVKIAPRVKQIVVARVELPKRQSSPDMVCVETAQLTFEGLLATWGVARVVAKPPEECQQRTVNPMTSRSSQVRSDQLSGRQLRVEQLRGGQMYLLLTVNMLKK
jgi:hypothetical protein